MLPSLLDKDGWDATVNKTGPGTLQVFSGTIKSGVVQQETRWFFKVRAFPGSR